MNNLSPRFAIEDIADEDYKTLVLLLADPEGELGLAEKDITTVTRINGHDINGRKICKQMVAYLKNGKYVMMNDTFNISTNFNVDMETMAVFIYECKRHIVVDEGGKQYYGDGGDEFTCYIDENDFRIGDDEDYDYIDGDDENGDDWSEDIEDEWW